MIKFGSKSEKPGELEKKKQNRTHMHTYKTLKFHIYA